MEARAMRINLTPDYDISRIVKGGWHLAGGHGPIDPQQALADMAAFVDAGITTFDCADIYTGVEELIGRFRDAYPALAARVQVHTKFVPDLAALARVDAQYVERCIDRSLERLRSERLDLVQFHWWDYSVPGYVEAAVALSRLKDKGKIAHIGVTNFDVPHLAQILDAGVPVIALQAQYSLLDERPEHGMVDLCRRHGIQLLCYGTVAGGFLAERWLDRPAPDALTNRSLVKYRLIIDEFGGWPLFQELLAVLNGVAIKHGCGIATVASRLMLDKEQVAGVIIGAVNAKHLAAHRQISALRLDEVDVAAVRAALRKRRGPEGDVYGLERDRSGRHGRIMKYELQQGEATH
jgi:aryl-alcohol dehydrogenase-like predicted oxidoreductase